VVAVVLVRRHVWRSPAIVLDLVRSRIQSLQNCLPFLFGAQWWLKNVSESCLSSATCWVCARRWWI
jgi:hypothetical protein